MALIKPWVGLISALRVLWKPWEAPRSALTVLRKPRDILIVFSLDHYALVIDMFMDIMSTVFNNRRPCLWNIKTPYLWLKISPWIVYSTDVFIFNYCRIEWYFWVCVTFNLICCFCARLFFTRANIFHVSELLKHQICVVCCCPFMELVRPVGPYITPHMDVTLLQVVKS